MGAAVKSTARRHLLKQGPEAAFTSAKDFYLFTFERANRTFIPTTSSLNQRLSATTINNKKDEDVSTDDETITQGLPSTRSIEVRWLDHKHVEKTFEEFLKPRWNQLPSKSKT